MDGAEVARELVQAHLAATLPARLALIETQLGLAAGSLPVPKITGPTDVRSLGLEETPAVMVVVRDTAAIDDDGKAAGGREYRVRYVVRCLAWARGQDYEDTGDNRDRYVRALREVLLGRLTMQGRAAKVLTPTWRESYSDVAKGRNERGLAAGYAEFTLELVEVLAA